MNTIRLPNLNPFVTNATGRLSYSTLNTLNECERKYQLEHLLVSDARREHNEHFSFGHCFGDGIAHYLMHQDAEAAILTGWLAYYPVIETDKKNQAKAIMALQAAFPKLDDILQDYELVEFNGKPAVELGFRMDIDGFYYFAGHVDVVLKNKWTGRYAIFEVKTTGLLLHDLDPLYKNSGQALGYSIALDRIAGQKLISYDVIYFIAQLNKDWTTTIHVKNYTKNLLDRLNWFITLGLDVKHLKEMAELGVYPKRGASCLQYMRPCKHFSTCGLHSFDRELPYVIDTEVYDFIYSLDSLIEEHLHRLQEQPAIMNEILDAETEEKSLIMEEI